MRGNPSNSAPSTAPPERRSRKLVKPLLDERDRQIVRNQLAAVVDRLDLSDRAPCRLDRRPEELARGDRTQIQRGLASARSAFLSRTPADPSR